MPSSTMPSGFSTQTVTALAEAVTGGSAGDSTPSIGHYRSGPKLERFFGGLNIELHIGSGSRVPTVLDKLAYENSQPEGRATLIRVIEATVDPRDYLDNEDKLVAVVGYMNKRLRFDGFELRKIGQVFKVVELKLNDQALPLALGPFGGAYTTPEFIWIPSDSSTVGSPEGVVVLHLPTNTTYVDGYYNPSWRQPAKGRGAKPIVADQTVANALTEVQKKMEAEHWAGGGYAANDSGAYGKEVHRQMALRPELQGNKWLHDCWVEKSTKEIVQIGGTAQPSGYLAEELQQVDIIRKKTNYTPAVGDVLDHTKIEDVYDIKTSVAEEMSSSQRASLKALNGGRDVKVAQTLRRWTQTGGWHDIEVHRGRRLRWLAAVGVAQAAMAMVSYADETVAFRQDVEPLLIIAENGNPSNLEKDAMTIEIQDAVGRYLSRFMPDSTPADIVRLFAMYKKLGHQ